MFIFWMNWKIHLINFGAPFRGMGFWFEISLSVTYSTKESELITIQCLLKRRPNPNTGIATILFGRAKAKRNGVRGDICVSHNCSSCRNRSLHLEENLQGRTSTFYEPRTIVHLTRRGLSVNDFHKITRWTYNDWNGGDNNWTISPWSSFYANIFIQGSLEEEIKDFTLTISNS